MATSLEEFRRRVAAEREAKAKPFPLSALLTFIQKTPIYLLRREEALDYRDPYELIIEWLSPIYVDLKGAAVLSVPRFAWNYELAKISEYTGIAPEIVYSTHMEMEGLGYVI